MVHSQMNRPYGAVDVAANLKGAVPKTAAQKILVALAERGDLVQKTYGAQPHDLTIPPFSVERSLPFAMRLNTHICTGKTVFFAPNQAHVDAPPADRIAETEKECAALEESNGLLAARVKAASSGTVFVHVFLTRLY